MVFVTKGGAPRPAGVLIAGVFLLLTAACARRTDRNLTQTLDRAKLALWTGELAEAQTIAERGLARAESAPDSETAWSFRLLRADILIARLQYQAADADLHASLPSERAFDPLRAYQQLLAAKVLVARGRLQDAMAALDRARAIAPQDADVRPDIDVLRGQVQLRLGRWADGESELNAVVDRARAAGDHRREALALNNLGMGRVVRNRYDAALPLFERVLSLPGLERLTVYGAALNNAGICYSRLGEFDRAVAVQQRSIDVHRTRGPRVEFEHALGELGNTYILQGDAQRATPYLQEAYAVANASHIEADAALWAGNLAEALTEAGDWNGAERFNDEARRLKSANHIGTVVFNEVNAAEIAAGRGRFDEARGLFNAALADAANEPSMRWEAHAGLAALAAAAHDPDRADRHFRAALDIIEKTRSDLLKTDYKLSFVARLIRFYRAYVDTLVDRGDAARALEVADSSRARVLAERLGTAPFAVKRGGAQFQRLAAASHTVILSYWLAPRGSYVWIVTPEGVRCVKLPPAAEIARLVGEYQSALASPMANPLVRSDAGDRLFKLLIAPAKGALRSGARLVIVPDGALYSLNFETLPVDGPRRHYFIEDAEISIAPSIGLLEMQLPASTAAPAELLLIGNPVSSDPAFPVLPNAASEMRRVASHFGDRVTMYEGPKATPAAYRDAHPERFALVHFTAHATANLESPLDSAVILSRSGGEYKLYARDVAEHQLHAALVTVSSCRGAGEREYSGEGLVGFAWAFLRAGARRVVAGLWDVDDRSTADFMDAFYARLAAGDEPGAALRAAKLTLLAENGNYAKPYYWGPFELFTTTL